MSFTIFGHQKSISWWRKLISLKNLKVFDISYPIFGPENRQVQTARAAFRQILAVQLVMLCRCRQILSDLHVQSCAKYSAVLGLMILLGRIKKGCGKNMEKPPNPRLHPEFPALWPPFCHLRSPFFWLPREDVVIREWQPPGSERFRVGTSNSWMALLAKMATPKMEDNWGYPHDLGNGRFMKDQYPSIPSND